MDEAIQPALMVAPLTEEMASSLEAGQSLGTVLRSRYLAESENQTTLAAAPLF
jgi:hypothetical protein